MFTGIVQGTATMLQVSGTKALKTLRIQFPKGSLKHVTKGASIAINGNALTSLTDSIDNGFFVI